MPRRSVALPPAFNKSNLVPVHDLASGAWEYHCQLPNGVLVYLGRKKEEVLANLEALNRLAVMFRNRWRGFAEAELQDIFREVC